MWLRQPSGSDVSDEGASLARHQLLELVEVAEGAVQVLAEWTNSNGNVAFTISLDTSRADRAASGINVRERERFRIVIRPGFPFVYPVVFSDHRRWARTPHVQWGSYLCLYAAPSVEWNPSDGMRGFIARLSEWVDHAAAGTLDPDGQPLHPPAVYSSTEAGRVLIHPDLGDRVPWATGRNSIESLVAWCSVNTKRRRVDIVEWIDTRTAMSRAVDAEHDVFIRGKPVMALPLVLSPEEFGFEYPQDFESLIAGLEESGYGRDALLEDVADATFVNRCLRQRQREQDEILAGASWDDGADSDAALLSAVLVGTPSRRVEGDARLAHLAAWRLDAMSAQATDLVVQVQDLKATDAVEELRRKTRALAFDLLGSSKIAWMRVMEMRPEVTRRRDGATPSTWLIGKRVLVLGAGALGAPVAELCLRGGAAQLTVADQGVVSPGILVRQPYSDDDIGRGKARALAGRLAKIHDQVDVNFSHGDVRSTHFSDSHNMHDYDLVINATADATVRAVIERFRKSTEVRPPLVTMVIGHDAERGLVVTNLSHASGGAADTFRKVSLLSGSAARGWADIRDDFFPTKPRTRLFFPEPGCSSPTFVGSAAQTTALAGAMMNEALMVLAQESQHDPEQDRPASFASAVRVGAAAIRGTSRAAWKPDLVQTDASGSFEVRVSTEAFAEARAEVRKGRRTRGSEIETGGMLLGAFDDATGVAYVDKMTGPPPDSFLSRTYFHHGTEGTQERLDMEKVQSGSVTGFLGFWHSHPDGPALPSATDEQGMAAIVGPDGTARRALMMIVGGTGGRWAAWRDGLTGALPDMYLRLVPRPSGPLLKPNVGDRMASVQRIPAGSYYRGGYSGDQPVDHDAEVATKSRGAVASCLARLRGHR